MIWIAEMKDGSIKKQFDNGKYYSSQTLDKDKLEKFKITETSGDTVAQFSADSGAIKFANLDYMKLMELQGKEALRFVYDKEAECFKLDTKSLKLMDKLVLKDERDYFYIEFDQTGMFNVGGQLFYMGFVTQEGQTLPFINQPPYNDFQYLVTNNEDFVMNSGIPTKKMNYVTSYSVGYKKTHQFENNLEFTVQHSVVFDVLKNCILLNSTVSCNKDMSGALFISFGDVRTANPIEFSVNETKFIPKMLTLM